jgi:TP901 family phage tail tape measure protein
MAARGFSLTAEINLRGPTNIRPIVNNIRRQLGSINANVNLNINRTTLGSIRQVNTSLGTLNTTLAATTSSTTSAAQAFTNLAAAMRSVGNVNLPQTVQAPMVRLASSANNASAAVSRTRTEFEDFGRQAGLAVRRFAAFSAVTSVIYGFSNALSAGIKQYIEFDRQITRLSQVTNESKASLSSMTSEITRLSTSMGVASEDLAQVSVTLAQAGFTAGDTRKALEALAKSALAPSFDNLNQTVEGSIALMRQFGISANQLEGALGSINAVAAGFAVEASDLIAAIQRTGGVFASASRGVSSGTDALNEFLAVFTSIRATTRESAETIATGLRTIFTRIQRGDTIEALKEYGVQLTDLEGKFVGPYVAVQRLAEGLGRLDPRDLKFSQIVEELGGFRQIGKVLPLIQQFATAQDALKVAQQGQGSLATDAAKGQLALAVQIQKVREEFTALVRSVGDSDGFKTMVRLGLDLASALIKIADATKGVLPLIGIMAAFRGVSALTQFAGGFGGGFRGTRRAQDGGRIYGFARGGIVPGSGNADSVPAMLTPGEFVVNKRAVNKYGRGNLVRMNRYADGGPVLVSDLLNRSGAAAIAKAIGSTNLEADDKVSIKIKPKTVKLEDQDFLKIWNTAENQAAQGSGHYKSYAGIDISQKNRDILRELSGKNRSEQKQIKQSYGQQTSDSISRLQSAEGRWGLAYEQLLIEKLSGQWEKASDKTNYPVDILKRLKNNAISRIGEVKFRTTKTDDADLISKLLRYRIEKKSVNRYFKENLPAPKIDDVNIGTLDYYWAGDTKKQFYDFINKQQQQKTPGFIKGGQIKAFAEGGKSQYTWAENKSFYDSANAKRTWYDVFEHGDKGASEVIYSGSFDEVLNFLQKKRTQNPEQQVVNEKFVGGFIQKFMTGSPGGVKQTQESFGTGETKFPRRITNAYAKQIIKEQQAAEWKQLASNVPTDERISIDDQAVGSRMTEPFDRAAFLASFKGKVKRDSLLKSIGDFAKFIGLPQEDLSVALPAQIDFGNAGSIGRKVIGGGLFNDSPLGSRGSEGWDLSVFGYTDKDKQDLFGYEKLVEEKKKLQNKILKTPIETFDDGSFSYDREAFVSVFDEIKTLQKKISDIKGKERRAIEAAVESKKQTMSATGRGSISLGTAFDKPGQDVLYHELTHQLFSGLRARSAESFSKYRERVDFLFNTDNDGLADAFDALSSGNGGGYTSADVVYGRKYKQSLLESAQLQNIRLRDNPEKRNPEMEKELASYIKASDDAKKAREYRPINPGVNQTLLSAGFEQAHITRTEDNGKEEFLTTLVQKAPVLDSKLQSVLDSTLSELLGSTGIKRQEYKVGGKAKKSTDKVSSVSKLLAALQTYSTTNKTFFGEVTPEILAVKGLPKYLSQIENEYGVSSAKVLGAGGENVSFDIGNEVLKISRTGFGIQQIAEDVGFRKKQIKEIGNYQLPEGMEHVSGYRKVKTFGKLTAAIQDKVRISDTEKGMKDAELLQGKLAERGLHWIDAGGSNMGYTKDGKPTVIDGMVLTKAYMDKYLSEDAVEDIEGDSFGSMYEWAKDIKKRKGKPRFSLGGMIQKFAEAGAVKEAPRIRDRVSALAQTKGQSIQETLLEQLRGLGGPAGVRTILGIGAGDSRTRSVLNANNIKANKGIEIAKDYVNRALFVSGKSDAAEAKRIASLTQVAIAGLLPMGYSDTNEWVLPESSKTIYATIKGFDKEYLPAAQQMSRETALAARNFAENVQYTKIFGGKEKLVFDFDETLVSGTDILNEEGKPDIPRYSDRTVVEEYLKGGRLTRLGAKLKTLIDADPEFIKNTRILTARPASTVDLLAQSLQSFGLPYQASDITGVGGEGVKVPRAKAQNLAQTEKLIDDSLDNIRAVQKSKKSGFLYTEPQAKPELDELMGQGNIEGAVIEKALAILGANLPPIETLESNRAIDFPGGLGRAAQFFGLPDNIPTEIKRTLNGSAFEKARGEFDRYYKEQAIGLADGGTVPALVSNGEAYVPPKLAKRIGYGKLNKMNQADRNGMGRFADGGISVFKGPGTGTSDSIPANLPVGSFVIREKATKALGLNRGGAVGVERFFLGGRSRGPSARPEVINADTIGATTLATTALTQLADVLTQLGVSGSESARLLNRSYQATAAEARRAAEADFNMARAAGASAETLYDLQQAINNANRAAQAELDIQQRLGNITGQAIQDALDAVEGRIEALRQAEENVLRTTPGTSGSPRTEEEVQAELRAGAAVRSRTAYEDIATGGGLGTSIDLSTLNATGDDLARVLQNLTRDARTLEQMDQRYIQTRRATIDAELRAGRITQDQAQEQVRAINEEIRARRTAIEQAAASRGERGPDEQRNFDRQASLALSFGVITVGNIIADSINAKSSAIEAGISGGIRGGSQAFSYTQAAIGELDNFTQNLRNTNSRFAGFASRLLRGAKAVQVVAILGQVALDAYNGVRQFYIELSKNKIEQALNGISEKFDKLNQDLTQVNLRQSIQSNLIDASRSADNLRTRTLDTASAGWINGLDVLFSSIQGNGASRQAAVRSQVLEKEGTIEYFRTLFGGADTYEAKAGKMVGAQAQESSQSFQPIAEGINQLIQARIKSGENVGDILGSAEFDDFARSLVYADTALNKQIRQIELSTGLTEKRKKELIEEIITIEGANKTRQAAAVAQREKDQKNLGAMVSVYTRSLKRMFTNMEQAINATAFSLKSMSENIDLTTAALQGQAKVGNIDLASANIIENPRSYGAGRVSAAQSSAGSLFGNRQPEMQQLMNLGETVENTVMSTINDTLKNQGPDSSNEVIARAVDKNIRAELKGLGLPPELADKLAKEVGSTLVDLRKSGDDKVDFAQLSEKLAGLNSVIETAKDAQSVAIKALQNYQNILNQYANNLNKIIDLEISARERSRKSIDITADSQLELSKTLNRTISVADVFAKRNASVGRQTGGITDPADIFNAVLKLNRTREIQQSSVQQSAEKGPAGVQDFVRFNNDLKATNISLRENRAALEEMANNTEKASAAMNAMQEAQQKATGRISFLEKVVTSTPDELESLNQSLYRLQRNMNGQQNTIQNSIGAQKAYQDAINNGASAMEAMRAAQTAFANERKDTLGALQDILPFLGDNQQANNTRANVLETMLQESGMGVSPMFQQILNSLRNPEQDPATAAAIQYYNQAIAEQSAATRLLGQLDQNLANDIASKNSKAIIDGLTNTILTFQNRELSDIGRNINTLVSIAQQPKPPVGGAGAVPPVAGIATGGLVYAAEGQLVNFQPRGTDTVPAMLTPGEFVINRSATQKHLPLLQQINNNSLQSGGRVGYYNAGGLITNWGKPDNIKQQGMLTEKPIIEPTDSAAEIWQKGSSNIYDLPNSYTLSFGASNALPTSSFDLNADNIIDKSMGSVRVGATPTIVKQGRDQYDYAKNDAAAQASSRIRGGLAKVKDNNSLYLGLGAFTGKQIFQAQEKEYQDKVKTMLLGIDGGPKPESILDKSLYRDKPPTTADFPDPTPNKWESTLVDKSYGVSFDKPYIGASSDQIQKSQAFKVWYYKRAFYNPAGWAPGMAMAVSVNKPSFVTGSPYADTEWSSESWEPHNGQTPSFVSEPMTKQQHILPGFKIDEANTKNHKPNYELYKNTLEFLQGRLGYVDDGSGQALGDKLSALFNNTQQYISLTGSELSPLDELITQGASSAVVAQPSLEPSFRTAIESVQANIERARRDRVKFGLVGAPPAKFDPEFNLGKPFVLTDEINRISKSFPVMINGNIEDYLGQTFMDEAKKNTLNAKGVVSSSLISDNIKLTLPIPINGKNPSIDVPIAYEKYTGQFYDATTGKFDPNRTIDTLLPNNIVGTLFNTLDKSQRRLFTAKQYGPNDIINASSINDPKLLQDFQDLIKMRVNKDPNAEQQAAKVASQLNLTFGQGTSLTKYLGSISSGADVFTDISQQPLSVNIGEFVLDKLAQFQQEMSLSAGKVDQSKITKGSVLTDADLPQATAALIRGSMALFGGLRLPGVSAGWLSNAGAPQAIRLALGGNPKGASQYMSSILNQAGTYVSQLQNRANSIQSYNALDNIMTMISGAANAFGAIAGGDTALLKQFYDAKAPIAGVFRSFGMSARAGKVAGLQLSPDWKNILGNQLQGTQIKVVGRDGTLTPTNLAGAIPENATVNDLVKVLFNPYNEFNGTKVRSGLIQKFGDDLFNLRGPNGMPYFDQITLGFIREGLYRLMNWYGGKGNWVGQDYFFDAMAQPDNAARMSNFAASFANDGQKYYDDAMQAHMFFGFANAFGALPSLSWFASRGAVAEPVNRAMGGIIYAQNGANLVNFQPRGTDTVPAMLTPGEFVVNRSATQKNLPLLKAINSNTLSSGGIVNYLADGGTAQNKLWIQSKNPLIAGLGWLGGVGEATGRAAYGAANVVAGAGISVAGRAVQGGSYLLGSESGQAAGQAFAQVGEQALVQGAYSTVELGQALAGSGPIQTGEQTALQVGDAARVESVRQGMGESAAAITEGAQTVGFVASQAAQALSSMGFSTGTSLAGKGAQALSVVDRLSDVGSMVSGAQKLPLIGNVVKGISSLGTNITPSIAKTIIAAGEAMPTFKSWLNNLGEGANKLGFVIDNLDIFAEAAVNPQTAKILEDAPSFGDAIKQLRPNRNAGTKTATQTVSVPNKADDVTDSASLATKASDNSDIIKLPKAQRLLVEDRLNQFKAMVQDAQSNRINAYIDNVEKELEFGIDSIDNFIRNNTATQKAYQDAISSGVSDSDALKAILYKDSGIEEFTDKAMKQGWSVDLGPPLKVSRNDDVIEGIISKDMESDTVWQQTRTKALADAEQGLSKEGRRALSKGIDDPSIKFEDRSWFDWTRNKTKNILGGRKKYIVGALALGGIYAATQLANQNTKPVSKTPDNINPPSPDNPIINKPEQANNDAAMQKIAMGAPPVMNPEELPIADGELPNYYDELTYKEWLNNLIKNGSAPQPPIKNLFKTPALYVKEKSLSFQDNKFVEKNESGRFTAFDERDGGSIVAGSVEKNKKLLLNAQTLEQKKLAQNARNNAGLGRGSYKSFGGLVNYLSEGGKPRQYLGVDSDQGGMPWPGSESSSPATIPETTTNDTFNDASGLPSIVNRDGSPLRTIEEGDRSTRAIFAAKGIESQFKSAYNYYQRKLGEYNYYNTKNDSMRSKWLASFDKKNKAKPKPKPDQVLGDIPDTVYASEGMLVPYQPRGTDTIPAMLTPGEFVVNRQATQSHLPLLHKINSGAYNKGGAVSYLSEGTKETKEEKVERLKAEREKIKAERIAAATAKRQAEQARQDAIRSRSEERGSEVLKERLAKSPQAKAREIANQRGKALEISREQGISPQVAMRQLVAGAAPVAAQRQAPAQAAMPQISPQTQQRVSQAAQAAFDPSNAGNVNKQLTIFGTLLTGVNQVMTQFGAIMQQIVAGGGVNNGVQANGVGGLDGLGQFTAKFDQFITQLSKLNLPPEINVNGNHKVEVVVNGAQALQELLDGPLSGLIRREVQSAFSRLNAESEGSIPDPTKQ